jgi:hypothetical protein
VSAISLGTGTRCRRPGAGRRQQRRHRRHAVHPHLPHAPDPNPGTVPARASTSVSQTPNCQA